MISGFPQPARLPKPVKITDQVWPEGTVPVVSIWCITYQHVNFIREAIDGFLMQETTFPVEILIHDDASSDGTADIVREYQATYPQVIRTVLQTENQYSKGIRPRNFLTPLVRGEFIALCEGDDYWIDPRKLQMQHDALTARPDSILVGAYAKVIDQRDGQGSASGSVHGPFPKKTEYGVEDLLHQTIHTSTFFYRKSLQFPVWAGESGIISGDLILQTLAAAQGPIIMVDRVVSCYRLHGGGIWAGKPVWMVIGSVQKTWARLDKHLAYRYSAKIVRGAICYAKKESCLLAAQGCLAGSYRVFHVMLRCYFPRQWPEFVWWALVLPFYRCRKCYCDLTKKIAIRSRMRRMLSS